MKYKVLLVDLDDTLLDFQKSEDLAIRNAFSKNNVPITAETINTYKQINIKYWKMFERGEIEKQKLLIERFKELITLYNLKGVDPVKFNTDYFDVLKNVPFELDGAYEFLNRVSKDMEIYVITNGVKEVQERRLSLVKIPKFFKKIYISEEIGANKPDKEYFDYVLNDLKQYKKEEIVVLGDSLTSDILGGINANLDTIWYNPNHLPSKNIKPKYEISNYNEFFDIVK